METRNIGKIHLTLTQDIVAEDKKIIFDGLFGYNVNQTNNLIRKPGPEVNIILKNNTGKAVGGIFCVTYLYCLYIDVLWIDPHYHGMGYGKQLLLEAEKIGCSLGCTFAHTTTYNFQAPHFYQSQGYEIFGQLDDFPNEIIMYFLKKSL